MNDDRLGSLLGAADESAGPSPASSPDLADRVRNIYQRRQSRTARCKSAAALAGFYVAGILTMWALSAFTSPRSVDVVEQRASTNDSRGTPKDAASLSSHERDQRKSPVDIPLEQDQVAVDKSPYQLLRTVGDVSRERYDFEAAIDYYSRALDAATEEELRIAYDRDNWLLISLKRDRILSQSEPIQGDST